VRFSTTKIDALVKKSNSNSKLGVGLGLVDVAHFIVEVSQSIMALSGRVEVDLTLALGYLMVGVANDITICHVIYTLALFK